MPISASSIINSEVRGYTGSIGYVGSRGTSDYTVSNTAPVSAQVGDRWLDSISGIEYTYLNDGDGNVWVELGSISATAAVNGLLNNNVSFGTSSTTTVAFNSQLASDLIPSANETYSLGSATNRWANIYLAANTINLGNVVLSASEGQLVLPSNVKIGNAFIDGTSGGTVNTSTASTGSVPKITTIDYPGDDTAANPAGGQTITLTGTGFHIGAAVILDGAAVGVVSVVSTTEITFTAPAKSVGSYIIYVVNPDGGTAIAVPGIQYSGSPTWSTAAGNIGSYMETQTISNTVTATGDAPITYSLASGTLPPGATLNANGTVTGTSQLTGSPTTYTFTVRASDAQNQDTDRSFNLTIIPDTVTWSSPAADTEYTISNDTAISNVSLSATSAAGSAITYTANALPTGISLSGNTISGTPTGYTENSTVGTLLTANATATTRTATRTISWTISVGDTYFNLTSTLLQADSGSFIADASTNNFAVTRTGDTRPSRSSPYWPGGWSVLLDGSSNYVTFNAFTGVGAWTVEFWLYMLVTPGTNVPIASQGQSDSTGNFIMYMTNTRTLVLYSNGSICQTTASVPLNQWSHIAYVSNASNNVTIYIDGVSRATGTYSGKTFNSTPFQINRGYGGILGGTNYYMSNFRMVKGTAVYTANFTPSTTALSSIAGTEALLFRNHDLKDYSANNYTLTVAGSAPIRAFSPFNSTPYSVTSSWEPDTAIASYSYTSSLYGASAYFDGTGDFLTLPTGSTWDFSTGDFTIEFWMYPSGTSGSYARFFQTANGDVYAGIGISRDNTANNIVISLSSNGSNYDISNGQVAFAYDLDTWTHFALVRNGNNFRVYKNGVQTAFSATSSAAIYYSAAHVPVIGGQTGSRFYAGYLSNFRIVKGTAVYTTNFTPPTAPLTAVTNTVLLTLQSDTGNNNSQFVDHSGLNHLITRSGNTTQGSYSPLVPTGWSAYFDGTGDYLTIPDNTAIQVGSSDFTFEAWAYPLSLPSSGNYKTLWAKRANSAGYGGACLVVDSSGNFLFFVASSSSAWGLGGSSTGHTVSTNTWQHLAMVRSGNTLILYKNGIAGTTVTLNFTVYDGTSSLSLMSGGSDGIQAVDGYMSNFRLVKGTALYTANFTPATSTISAINNTSLLCLDGPTFTDDGPNNFAITRNGDVRVTPFSPFRPHSIAPNGYSVYFDGNTDYLTVAANTAFQYSTGNFTIEFWINYASLTNYQTIISSGYVGSVIAGGWIIQTGNGDGKINLYYTTSGNALLIASDSGAAVSANTWYHIAVVRNAGTTTIYRNGQSVGSASDSINYNANSNVVIGGGSSTGFNNYWVNGHISNLRILKGTALYTSNFTPSTTALTSIANTSLLTCQSSTIIDNSTNAFAITVNGDARPRSFNPFGDTVTPGVAYAPATHGGSAYFDGTGDQLSIVNNSAFNLPGDFTVECWVNFGSVAAIQSIISNYASSTTGWGLQWRSDTTRFNFFHGDTSLIFYSFTPVTFTWYHLVVTRSGTSLRMFLNGSLVATATDSTSITSANPLIVGSLGGQQYLTGYVSNVRIIKGTALYTSAFVPALTAPAAVNNTSLLLNFTNAGIVDATGRAVFETVGDSSVNTAVKKYGSGSMYFDGTGDYLKTAGPISNYYAFGTSDFTVEMWAYFNALPTAGNYWVFFDTRPSGQSLINVTITLKASTIVYYSNAGDRITSGTVSTGVWYHVAVSRSGSSTRMFIDGTQVGSTYVDSNTYTSAADRPFIGGDSSVVSGLFNGYIDDLRVTRSARYTSNFTPPALHQTK